MKTLQTPEEKEEERNNNKVLTNKINDLIKRVIALEGK